MPSSLRQRLAQLMLAICATFVGSASAEELPIITLQNGEVSLQVTPNIGGRVLGFHQAGKPNVLKVGDAVQALPNPDLHVDADNIDYLGHTVWIGPQSEWWSHQDANVARRQSAADWPPDPFLELAQTKVLLQSRAKLVLEGPASPISGLQLTKSFELLGNRVDLTVEALNQRDEEVAWDIWFNTRLSADCRVYVPVESPSDVRVDHWTDDDYGRLQYQLREGVFKLEMSSVSPGKIGRQGKVFLQPSAGWMAGITRGQLFIHHLSAPTETPDSSPARPS